MTLVQSRAAAVAWTFVIILACSIPGEDLPGLEVKFLDKVAHFTLFAILAWLWLRALRVSLPPRYLFVIAIGTLFGALTEIYQGMLPWDRTPDLADAVANMLGLLGGSGLYALRHGASSPDRGNV